MTKRKVTDEYVLTEEEVPPLVKIPPSLCLSPYSTIRQCILAVTDYKGQNGRNPRHFLGSAASIMTIPITTAALLDQQQPDGHLSTNLF